MEKQNNHKTDYTCMQKSDLLFFRKWFRDYVKSFYSNDHCIMQNIRMKEDHSWRVCSNSIQIAKSVNLPINDLYLAETIAIFHDIGRFEQFSRYGTFKDSESEDHALLGVRLLVQWGILSRLNTDEQKIVLFAVENHNKFSISTSDNKKCILHSQIVRDADKLDILKVFIDEYMLRESTPNPSLYMGYPDASGYSESIVLDILNNTLSDMEKVKNQNDLNLTRLTWMYDLNFIESFRLLKKRNFLEMIVQTLPQNDEIIPAYFHLKEYLNSKTI
jgi:HD superfamily phosphodiesterase